MWIIKSSWVLEIYLLEFLGIRDKENSNTKTEQWF